MQKLHKKCICCNATSVFTEDGEDTMLITSWVCPSIICAMVFARYKAHKPQMTLRAFYMEHAALYSAG